MIEPVVKSILVPCNPDTAFDIFVNRIADWWPVDQMSMTGATAPLTSLTIDARPGGAITEVAADGAEHIWGSVAEVSPGERLVIHWHVGRPATEATLIDLVFVAEGGGTRVTLTHSNWEALGQDAEATRGLYDDGWVLVFDQRFCGACNEAKARRSA